MKQVTIKRSQWQRGGDGANHKRFNIHSTSLWDTNTKCGCCLGHVLHQAHRVMYLRMNGIHSPEQLANHLARKNPLVEGNLYDGYAEKRLASEAMKINDSHLITDSERENRLRSLFKKNGYELTFVD